MVLDTIVDPVSQVPGSRNEHRIGYVETPNVHFFSREVDLGMVVISHVFDVRLETPAIIIARNFHEAMVQQENFIKMRHDAACGRQCNVERPELARPLPRKVSGWNTRTRMQQSVA